jgi:FAD/FMN-containing dehydrogenase
MPGGNLGPGIVVSLAEGFREVGPVVPDVDGSGRIRVGAGVTAAEVEAAAAPLGLRFPPLPSSARWATIGGMAANNAAGARSFGRGAMAAWVESVEGITAFGEPFRAGPDDPFPVALANRLPTSLPERWPRVRKNSSGYGLDRWLASSNPAQLLVGSEGTLCIITSATLRLDRTPPARGVRLLPVAGPAQAAELAVAAEGLGAVACEFLGHRLLDMARLSDDPELGGIARGAWALFLLEFEGETTPEVEDALDRAARVGEALDGPGFATTDPRVAERLWALRQRASPLISDLARSGRVSTQFIEDSVVPPVALGRYLEGLDRVLADAGGGMDAVVFGHAGDGNVHVNPLVDLSDPAWRDRVRSVLAAVVDLVAGLGGTLSGEHGDGRLRAPFLERIWGTDAVGEFRRVREAFDPHGVLNPGVILPLEGQDPLSGFQPRPRDWPA